MGDIASPLSTATAADAVDALRSRMQGQIVLPGDSEYEQYRRGFNLTVDQHPAVIALPETTADIAEAARFAFASGLDIGVMATGHGTVMPADDSRDDIGPVV